MEFTPVPGCWHVFLWRRSIATAATCRRPGYRGERWNPHAFKFLGVVARTPEICARKSVCSVLPRCADNERTNGRSGINRIKIICPVAILADIHYRLTVVGGPCAFLGSPLEFANKRHHPTVPNPQQCNCKHSEKQDRVLRSLSVSLSADERNLECSASLAGGGEEKVWRRVCHRF